MTEKSTWHKIPAEEAVGIQTWVLPTIGGGEKVLPSFEKEERERRAVEQRAKTESVSIVEIDPAKTPIQQGPTAEDLQKIFEDAERDGYSKGRAQGLDQGLAEGRETGRLQAYAEFKAQLVDEHIRFKKLADAFEAPLGQRMHELESMLVKSIALMTQSVIKRELQIDSSHIVALVQEAVEALPVGFSQLILYVSPQDVPVLENYIADNGLQWQLIADATISAGGLRVETAESRIDERVEVRLKNVLQQFLTKQLSTIVPPEPEVVVESSSAELFPAEENESPLASFGLDDISLSESGDGT